MELVYGHKSVGRDDKYHRMADEVMSMIAVGQLPGAYMVNLIPARQFLTTVLRCTSHIDSA